MCFKKYKKCALKMMFLYFIKNIGEFEIKKKLERNLKLFAKEVNYISVIHKVYFGFSNAILCTKPYKMQSSFYMG